MSLHQFTNKLIGESSPYLLQHAHNPVDWFPWGDEVLKKAKEENKLLIISIGYAACHWCHVMEHESFEDENVAKIMNEHFVSIKVDREERPDIDQVYMDAAFLITGRGGWPLNIIALPDGRPVFAGTYFRKDDWIKILLYFKELYQKEPETFEREASKLTRAIQSIMLPDGMQQNLFTKNDLSECLDKLISFIDFDYGGTKGAPKFPMPNIFEFLLTYYYHTKNLDALKAVTTTLDRMAAGGIYDHIGGGFARYSTDEMWKVPHFEKMLYDNAQLVSLYSNAFKVTKNNLYKKIVFEILEFIEREMTDSSGGFCSSLDADSEGEEGKFYLWGKEDIDKLLGKDSDLFCDYFNVSSYGNWEGKNILYTSDNKDELLTKYNIDEKNFDEIISKSKKILFERRAKRIKPGLDDKILTSWNALMLKGYISAYDAFSEENFLNAAIRNGEFILTKMMSKDGRLNRNYKNGKASINAFLDDYAYTIEAFISLYESTFDEKWIYAAKKLADYVKLHFYYQGTGLFFYTSDIDNPLIARKMDLSDNVTPASNSSLAIGLYKLSHYFSEENYGELANKLLKTMRESIIQNPSFHSNWLILGSYFVFPFYEVGIVGIDALNKRAEFAQTYLPDIILFGSTKDGSLEILKERYVNGRTVIYVCEDRVCKLPVEDAKSAIEQLS